MMMNGGGGGTASVSNALLGMMMTNSGSNNNNNNNNILSTVLKPDHLEKMLTEILGSKEEAHFVIDSLKKRAQSTPLSPQVLATVNAMAVAEVEKAEKLMKHQQEQQKKADQQQGGRRKQATMKK